MNEDDHTRNDQPASEREATKRAETTARPLTSERLLPRTLDRFCQRWPAPIRALAQAVQLKHTFGKVKLKQRK